MTNWASEQLAINGISIHYHRTGGNKPPILLLHGITDNGLCWTRVTQALENDYDLIMPDARGHGESDKPATGYHPRNHAADAVGLIAALGLQRPTVMGHSMGADVAAVTAALYPDAVGALILEDPPWRHNTDAEHRPDNFAEEWRQGIIRQRSQTRDELLHQIPSTWHDIEREAWVIAHQQVSPDVLEYVRVQRGFWQEVVHQIACPVLLVIGDKPNDAILNLNDAERIKKLIPHMTVAQIEGTGHSIHRDNFEGFMEVVRGFLSHIGQA